MKAMAYIRASLTDRTNSIEKYHRRTGDFSWKINYKIFMALLGLTIIAILLFVLLEPKDPRIDEDSSQWEYNLEAEADQYQQYDSRGYLVATENCRIPNIDPYQPEVMKSFVRRSYTPCSNLKPLTRVDYNETKQRYTLRIIKERIELFTTLSVVKCYFRAIKRSKKPLYIDSGIILSKWFGFDNEFDLPPTIYNILVNCSANGSLVYVNGHAMMPERASLRKRIIKWKLKDAENQQRPINVIMLGINSLSRINLGRAMPKTAEYLYQNAWFPMSGYNKIDGNTFPNLMAVLTGLDRKTVKQKCNLYQKDYLDICATAFIWNTFREHGYVTAFGEDSAAINVFNQKTRGFLRKPVDYYQRPFFLVARKHLAMGGNKTNCIGYQHYADFIFDYAEELVKRFQHVPYFGFYWMSSISHNNLNEPTALDEHFVDRLRNFMALDAINNTIVILFSDHGLRNGPILRTLSGYYEDRLPAMFIWLPKHLRKSHPEFVDALSVNRQRLTNHYDLHMTLKHVLALSKRVTNPSALAPAESCPRCQTLLAPVSVERTCEDIAIEQYWCACFNFQRIDKNTKIVHDMVQLIIAHMNSIVRTLKKGTFAKICKPLELKSIQNAYQKQSALSKNSIDKVYRLHFSTAPNSGLFEVTVKYNELNGDFRVLGNIRRLNSYAKDSRCILSTPELKKLCVCPKAFFNYF